MIHQILVGLLAVAWIDDRGDQMPYVDVSVSNQFLADAEIALHAVVPTIAWTDGDGAVETTQHLQILHVDHREDRHDIALIGLAR